MCPAFCGVKDVYYRDRMRCPYCSEKYGMSRLDKASLVASLLTVVASTTKQVRRFLKFQLNITYASVSQQTVHRKTHALFSTSTNPRIIYAARQ